MTTLYAQDFGPLGTADDRPTIQAALDAAYALADPVLTEVVIPPGLYWLKGALHLGSYTHLIATGARLAWNGYSPTSMLRCRNVAPVFGYEGEHDFQLTGGIWDGNRSSVGDGTNLISIVHARNFVLRQFHATAGFDHHLVEINACELGTIEDFELSDSGSNSEALQVDGMFNPGVYSEFGAWDNSPSRNLTIHRGVIHGVRDGIGSHTVEPSFPHRAVHLEDLRIVCSGIGLKLRGYRDVTLAGVIDITAPTPFLWEQSGRVILAGAFAEPTTAADPLPDPLPALPAPPPAEPPPDPPPTLPPPEGTVAMHVCFFRREDASGTWSNMPAALTEVWNNPGNRMALWLGPFTQMLTAVNMQGVGAAGAEIGLEFSADRGATWTSFGAWASLAALGNAESPWVAIPPAAKQDVVLVRMMGRNGNGVADPQFGSICAVFG